MAVYVDSARNRLGRMIVCHMAADTERELHAMAQAIGMRLEWFQNKRLPHYDVSLSRRKLAVSKGAVEITGKQLVLIARRMSQ